MRRRAPLWFTHSKVREHIQNWWPWGLGIFAATLYALNPEPLEEVRAATLANLRKPILRATEWIEVHDLDPETAALELPPQQLFGPLPLEQQMKFVMAALRHDDDLADDYVTRMVIDAMDMSLDPPRKDTFVKAGGAELLQFAVDDFSDKREHRKRKFFGPDQFLRLINMCAPHYELANMFVTKCDGVELTFRALKDAENEYARVLATRSLTLFALLQPRNGEVERRILEGGHLPSLVDAYRLSTGDPTDTRFTTLLLSSIMRCYRDSEAVYNTLVAENVVSAVIQNLNLTRYKGVPQHLRVLQDLRAMREHLTSEPKTRGHMLQPAAVPESVLSDVGGATRAKLPAPRTRLQAYFAKEEDEARMQREKESLEGVKMLPPRDLHAPVEQIAYDCEFLPVALGVLDVFPEYFEASAEMLKWIEDLVNKGVTSNFELLEYRGATVLAKLVYRLEKEPKFFARDGAGERACRLFEKVLKDEECEPFVREGNDTLASVEMKTAVRNMREFMARFERLRSEFEATGELPKPPPQAQSSTITTTNSAAGSLQPAAA